MTDSAPSGARRERKRANMRNSILEAAAEILRQKEYEDCSVDDIAEAADISKRTLYNIFESKEEIVMALRIHHIESHAIEALELARKGKSPLKAIESFLVSTAEWSQENAALAKTIFAVGPPLPKPRLLKAGIVMPPRPPFLKYLVNLVELGQERGELREDADPQFMAHMLTFVIIHIHVAIFMPMKSKAASPVKLAKESWRNLLEGFGAK